MWANTRLALLIVFIVCIGSTIGVKNNLCSVMEHYTERSCYDFLGYGCWCGLGGQGNPVDAADECCKTHDKCYGEVQKTTRFCMVYFKSYATDSSVSVCQDPAQSCSEKICRCDIALAKCLSIAGFNRKYRNYRDSKCTA